jgi:hypothetical protein
MKPISVVLWAVALTEAYVTTCISESQAVAVDSSFDTSAPVDSLRTQSASILTWHEATLSSSAFQTKTASPANTIHSSCQADDPCIGGMTFYDTADTA